MVKKKQTKEEAIEQQQKEGELLDTLQRLQAEFENYKKRTAKEHEEFKQSATRHLIRELLPSMDNFELALKNNEQESDFSKGVELIFAQQKEVLANHGVEKIDAQGKPFDPLLHEALMTKHDEKHDNNVVLEVLQDGYTMNGKILRPAKVIVNKT